MQEITPVRTYAGVLAALLGLTALTTGVAFIDLGRLNTPVAIAIAIAKASMVALIFMHLRDSSRLTYIVVLAALFWLGIMIVLSMSDYLTRGVLTYG